MLDDKYRIERLLAEGGMGAVYAGTHIKLRKRVAIKVLNPRSRLRRDRTIHREAIMASQIGHEGTSRSPTSGPHAGEPFLSWSTLAASPWPPACVRAGAAIDVACELGCTILAPLGAAHAAGIGIAISSPTTCSSSARAAARW